MRHPDPTTFAHEDEHLVYRYDAAEWFSTRPYEYFTFAYRNRIDFVLQQCKKLLKPGNRILDIGCAQANLALILAENGFDVTACDINPHFLDYARRKYEHGTLEFKMGNAFEILPPKPTYHLILAMEVIEHVAYPEQLFEQINSLLLPGGYCILTTPNGGYFKSNLPSFTEITNRIDRKELEARQFKPEGHDHLFLFSGEELKTGIRQSGLELKALDYLNSLLPSVVHRLLGRLQSENEPTTLYELDRMLCRIPVFRHKFSNSLIACIRKPD